jgi:hypothetical protein
MSSRNKIAKSGHQIVNAAGMVMDSLPRERPLQREDLERVRTRTAARRLARV